MGNGYGRRVRPETIGRTRTLSTGVRPEYMPIGMTFDWSTVDAVTGADYTVPDADGLIVAVGKKFLPIGQVVCKITSGGSAGQWGQYDPAAAGTGRDTLRRGECAFIDRTVLEDEVRSNYIGGLVGGQVWKSRIKTSVAAAHTKALGPTLAEIEAAFPRIEYGP